MIETVLGRINKNQLGRTLCHEHLIMDLSSIRMDSDSILDNVEDISKELTLAKNIGLNSVIEVTNIGMGRNVKKLKEISKATGINVIASTGFYKEEYFPSYIKDKSEEQLCELMVKEIVEGIDGTDSKAGIIAEIGTSHGNITPLELKLFKAASMAHHKTNVSISTHCEMGTMGREQVKILTLNKVDLDRTIIGHMDLNPDIKELIYILEKGANIGFDTIGKENYLKDDDRLSKLLELIYRGFGGQNCNISRYYKEILSKNE